MTGIECDICKTQQHIYEYMASEGYDMALFSDAYLKSDFCKRAMDSVYSRFQLETPLECADFYMPEIAPKLKKLDSSTIYDPDVAGWIGFVYRQICMETKTPSARLARSIPFRTMEQYYPGMHTIDEDEAARIIIENVFGKR